MPKNIPPKVAGRCDDCGAELILRKDDTEKTIRKRLRVYEEQTEPLISYYDKKKLLKRFCAFYKRPEMLVCL